MLNVLIWGFLALIAVYAAILGRDLLRHRREVGREKGNALAIGLVTAFIQFLATFGISDFSMSIPVYRGAKWVEDRRLPGTLFTAAVIPGSVISILYISGAAVEAATLLSCLISQSLGSVIGVKIVANMNGRAVRRAMGIALLASVAAILARMLGPGSGQGALTGFGPGTLAWLIPVYVLFGVVNTLGFGVKALSMALLMTLGLDPGCVLAVALSSCGFGCCCGAVQFIRKGLYQRKIALVSSIAGTAGVMAGAFLVKGLPTDILQWIMIAVMLYAAATMLREPGEG